jgi:uncharacterized protein
MHRLATIDWNQVNDSLSEKGFCKLANILSPAECVGLRELYTQPDAFRSTINMERYRFGKGEYKYFSYPLPEMVQSLRESFYSFLVPIANQWMNMLSVGHVFPKDHAGLIRQCHAQSQVRSTPLLLRYEAGGFNTLHQDLYGTIYFPLQVVFSLSLRDKEYQGGELALTTQLPRAQSKVSIITPDQGDAVIITTNFRPAKGTRGYYRATVKHGVSEVTQGIRFSLGIIFHDAL